MLDAKAGESLANLWDDGKAAGMSEPELLLYRSNLLGADKRITNYGGGNTSAKVRERVAAGTLRLHGWWFDIGQARVHVYRPDLERFTPIDELEGERMLAELESSGAETSSSAA